MKKYRYRNPMAFAVVIGCMHFSTAVFAQSVDSVIEADEEKIGEAIESQQRVEGIADQIDDIVVDFKVVNKEIQGLKAYNAQLELQIKDQQTALNQLDASIADATGMERFIAPLMEQMIDALDQYVSLDLPFDQDVRQEAVDRLHSNIARSDLTLAEKFRQVLEVYKIESDYSNAIDTYTDRIQVNGAELDVNILRIGRIALMYQTKDQVLSGFWDSDAGQWAELDAGQYRGPISDMLKIAKKQASIDILTVPVSAPEAAR